MDVTILTLSDVARSLGVSGQTVKNWIDKPELTTFFSTAAHGKNKARRTFTTDELYMLNTVRIESAKTPPGVEIKWAAIADRLKAGDVDRELPPESITATNNIAPVVAIEQMVRLQVEHRVQGEQIDKLERNLEAEREARRQAEERLNREIGALQHENRELRKRLGDKPSE